VPVLSPRQIHTDKIRRQLALTGTAPRGAAIASKTKPHRLLPLPVTTGPATVVISTAPGQPAPGGLARQPRDIRATNLNLKQATANLTAGVEGANSKLGSSVSFKLPPLGMGRGSGAAATGAGSSRDLMTAGGRGRAGATMGHRKGSSRQAGALMSAARGRQVLLGGAGAASTPTLSCLLNLWHSHCGTLTMRSKVLWEMTGQQHC